ncbi:MAG: capsule biosynthesis GfcC family protein [Magnetococcales bacterium]|nr:capsule biosynthesis GfcC family protein [Magnetococcales bacterium]
MSDDARGTLGDDLTIVLRDGDRLVIPPKSNEVTVMGEVHYPASHLFMTQKSLEDYINLSGGYDTASDSEKIYVVKANGQVVPRKATYPFGTSWFHLTDEIDIRPGDTIVVPMAVDHVAPLTLVKDVAQIMFNLAVTISAIKTAGVGL